MIARARKLLNGAMLFSIISSVPILCYGLVGIDEQMDVIVNTIFPALFWIGLAGEQICVWVSWHSLKAEIQAAEGGSRPGIAAVFQTKAGKTADLIFVGSASVLLILMILDIGQENIQLILLFSTVLSFRLHCMLNGRIYQYIQNDKKGKDEEHD